MKKVQSLLSVLLIVATWLVPADLTAKSSCPSDYPVRISHGCRRTGGWGVRCDPGYQGQFKKRNGFWIGSCVPNSVAEETEPFVFFVWGTA